MTMQKNSAESSVHHHSTYDSDRVTETDWSQVTDSHLTDSHLTDTGRFSRIWPTTILRRSDATKNRSVATLSLSWPTQIGKVVLVNIRCFLIATLYITSLTLERERFAHNQSINHERLSSIVVVQCLPPPEGLAARSISLQRSRSSAAAAASLTFIPVHSVMSSVQRRRCRPRFL